MKQIRKIKLEYILLTIILIFALFIRVYALGSPPLWVDEATSSMASLMTLEKAVPVFDSGLLYGRAYLFHYSQAFFLLFGQTDFLARFASVIFGLLTIFLAYKIGNEYSKSGGIISALFMSVFYLEVFFSRQARFYQLFQLMFFLSVYLLYKSKPNRINNVKKEKNKGDKGSNKNLHLIYLIASLISLFITINIQIAGLVLCPFFIIHILYYNRKTQRFLAILPAIPLIQKFFVATGLSADSTQSAINYASQYAGYTSNMVYLLILFVPGVIWSFVKKKRLTTLMILPSIIMLIGVFSLQTFALRYSYFIVFPLVLFSSLLMSFLYEKYGKIMLFSIFLLLLIPSNIFYPQTGVNIIKPIDYNYYDSSSPEINLKDVPIEIRQTLINPDNTLITFFSSSTEWYLRKPDLVLPFSMDGRGDDQISYNKSDGSIVDVYSGAGILKLNIIPNKPYYIIADYFSVSKLKPAQKDNLDNLIKECEIIYENRDVKIYGCE